MLAPRRLLLRGWHRPLLFEDRRANAEQECVLRRAVDQKTPLLRDWPPDFRRRWNHGGVWANRAELAIAHFGPLSLGGRVRADRMLGDD